MHFAWQAQYKRHRNQTCLEREQISCILEHQIFSFPKLLLRDRCSTSYDLAPLFCDRRRSWGQHSTFHFEGSLAELLHVWCCQLPNWRKSRRIAAFVMLSTSTFEGSLAELLRFWCCQLPNLKEVSLKSFVFQPSNLSISRTSRRIAKFSFKLEDRQLDR